LRRRQRRRPLRGAEPWRWRTGAAPKAPVARLSRAAWLSLTTLSTMVRVLLRNAAGAPAEPCPAGFGGQISQNLSELSCPGLVLNIGHKLFKTCADVEHIVLPCLAKLLVLVLLCMP